MADAEERDELSALRAAWRALEAPAPDAELDRPDARTEAAVAWMRDAWRALEAPGPSVVRPRAPHLFAGGPRRLGWLAAAAVVWIAAVPVLRHALETEVPEAAPAEPVPTRLAALEREDGAIALRSGPVSLVLVLPDRSSD